MKGGSEYHLKAQFSRLEQWSNTTPISAKDLSRLHQFGSKALPGIFLGYVLCRLNGKRIKLNKGAVIERKATYHSITWYN